MTIRSFLVIWLGLSLWGGNLARGAEAGRPDPLVRMICQYALTSANDFPERDPQDWRLLGSNDDGKTWTTVDLRKGEIFSARQQRRVFQLSTPAMFNLFRLQIDRVRGPETADCVQLAEIEPLGEKEDDTDPVPALNDVITAQGVHPPLETYFQAFDGKKETKWLDFARENPSTRSSWIQWQYFSQKGVTVTNVQELLGLGRRAREGYHVQITGVLVDRLAENGALCFLDGTGHLEIPDAGHAPIIPGQRILLEATSQWTNRQVTVDQCQWKVLPSNVSANPNRITLDQPLPEGEDQFWAEAEGEIAFCSSTGNQLVLELDQNETSLSLRVLHWGRGEKPPPVGARVRVRGICEAVLNAKGQKVPGVLWVASLAAITCTTPVPPLSYAGTNSVLPDVPGNRAPWLTHVDQIRQLSPEQLGHKPKVKVRGVVTDVYGEHMQEDQAGIEVLPPSEEQTEGMADLGTWVQVEGQAIWGFDGPIILAQKVEPLGKGNLPRPEHCSWSQLVRGKMVDQWVEIEGVVHSTDGSHLLLNCDGGQVMATIGSARVALVRSLVDATVRIRGVSVAAVDNRGQTQGAQFLVPSLEFVEVEQSPADPLSLPAKPISSLLQLRNPNEFIHRTKVKGVLTCQEEHKYFLQDQTNSGVLAVPHEEVTLMTIPGPEHWLFWQKPNATNGTATAEKFEIGDVLEVSGFPETRGFSPVLSEALVHKIGHAGITPPAPAKIEEIFLGSFDSTLVTLEAVVLGRQMLGSDAVYELQSGQKIFQAILHASRGDRVLAEPGSRVKVTGVCQIDSLPYPELGQRVVSFKLLLRSPADFTILERPPWWTAKRAFFVVGTSVMVLAIAGAWIGLLRRQVKERTKQLQQEVAEHEHTEERLAAEARRVQAEIEERKRVEVEVEQSHRQLLKASRLAGMAEVATSVLHNVGNVLNSANVLSSLIVEQVKGSKINSVSRLARLLAEHRAELDRFLTQDERGRQLPGYLDRLAGHLEQEQSKLLTKVVSLTESIQHIKEIVATQQNYAKISGVLEEVSLAEITEDALRMHSGSLARHQIKVERDYQTAPPVTIDRHKLLQILFNLLENAKYACEGSQQTDPRVVVRIRHESGRVQLVVSDNGVGISPGNLGRIFVQGFSTRKGGHGFGLHNSILAAQDMGGSLAVQSEGVGKGATFTLEIPVVRKEGPKSPKVLAAASERGQS